MCYYRAVTIKNGDLIKINNVERQLEIESLSMAVMDGFAYSYTPVIVPKPGCTWDLVSMEWGFIPYYLKNREAVYRFRFGYKDDSGKFTPPITTLNAIGEELLLPGKMYRDAALKRRCLFVTSGFYEWRHLPQIGKKGQPLKATRKIPYHIRVKEKPIFFIAGIWQNWTDKDTGETVDTCALVTTKANALMEQVHNVKKRMPTILTEELAGEWISYGLSESRITEIATTQYPTEQMEAWTVAKEFKTALEPSDQFEWEDVPQLILNEL
jgi:putative SOS response-associated peptidase YedK